MNRYLIYILVGLVVVAIAPAQAASVGSPQTQGRGKIATTLEWSYIFNRDLDFEKATRPAGQNAAQPLNFRITRGYDIATKISYGIFDFMDLYLKLGVANYGLKGDVFVGGAKRVEENLSARNAFLYGGGAKLAYPLKDGWVIGFDAQYLNSNHVLDFRAHNLATGATATAKYGVCWLQEWEAAPYIAKKIKNFTPYFGARYSGFRMEQKNPHDPLRWDNLIFNADTNVGVFTGIDWDLAKSFKLNVEGRFIDETAINLGATYKF